MAKKKTKKTPVKKAKAQRGRPRIYTTPGVPYRPQTPPELEIQGNETKWPKNEPMPQSVSRAHKTPCPKCRLVSGKHGQAALCQHTGKYTAYMQCRYCNHRWTLPTC